MLRNSTLLNVRAEPGLIFEVLDHNDLALKPRPVEAMEMILAYCIERHAKGNQLDVSDKLVLKARDEPHPDFCTTSLPLPFFKFLQLKCA